jgi:hypothetical protein
MKVILALFALLAICSAQQVRFFCATTGSTTNVDVLFTFTTLFTNIPYGTMTAYTSIAPNTYVVTLRSTGTATTVSSLPNVILAPLNSYTLVAAGDATPTLTLLVDTINSDPTTPLLRASQCAASVVIPQTVLLNNIPFGQPPAGPNPIAFGQSTGFGRTATTTGTLVFNGAGTVTAQTTFNGVNGGIYDVFMYGSTTNTARPVSLLLVQNVLAATPTAPTTYSFPSFSFSLPSSVPRLFRKRV